MTDKLEEVTRISTVRLYRIGSESAMNAQVLDELIKGDNKLLWQGW